MTICHATPPDTAADGYVRISPSAAGVFNGHLKEHAADIIPPFTYNGQTYSLNWDATGQAIWNNGCAVPSSSTSGGTNGASHGKGAGHGKGNQGGTHGNSSNAHQHVTICHATPPDTAANGYVMISPSASGVFHGHLRQHAADIIPPFTYNGQTYSLNWDATGQAIFNNGCVVPSQTAAAKHTTAKKSAAAKHSTTKKSTAHKTTKKNTAGVLAAAKAVMKAIVEALAPSTHKGGVAAAHKTQRSGVAAAHKTLKRVTHRAHAARPTTSAASFTG